MSKLTRKWKATALPTKQAESVAEFLRQFTPPKEIIVKTKEYEI